MISDSQVAAFKRDGFLLLKRVFSPQEVELFWRAGSHVVDSADLASIPALEGLWCDRRIVEVARRLIGDPLVYFGEASYQRKTFAPGSLPTSYLHHDAKGTIKHLFNRQHAPVGDFYPVIRFATYLQDHSAHSGGLKLVPGSHRFDSSDINLSELTYLNVPTEPGDLVLFCNKTLHAAHALRLKDSPAIALSPTEDRELSLSDPGAFLPIHNDRRAIFVDFVAHDEASDIYIKGRALNLSNPRSGLVRSVEDGSLLKQADAARVTLRLDSGVVEALTQIADTAVDGRVTDAGIPFLKALPQLCRLSQGWTSYFNFVPPVPDGPNEVVARDLMFAMFQRVDELRELLKSVHIDKAMLPYEIAMQRGLA